MICPKCKSGEHTYNQWLPYNERIRDFIRWNELGWIIITCSFLYLICGLWGLLLAGIIYKLNHLEGGPVAEVFKEYTYTEQKIKQRICGLGHKDCIYTARVV
jgi:hypothetical protein